MAEYKHTFDEVENKKLVKDDWLCPIYEFDLNSVEDVIELASVYS